MKPYRLGLYEKAMPAALTIREKLAAAKAFGYDYLELSIDETDAMLARLDSTPKERHAILEAVRDVGLPIGSVCLSGHRKYPLGSNDAVTEARSLEIVEKAIVLASELGVRIIQLAGYDVYYEPSNEKTTARFLRNLKKSVSSAARYGVTMGFETMETEFMNTVEKAMDCVKKINSPYLGVYPDIGNCTNAARLCGADEFGDLRKGAGHIVALHLKESKPGVFREVPFGAGHVDFDGFVRETLEMGVGMFVTELWHTNDCWEKEIIRTKAFVDAIFADNVQKRSE